MTLALARGMADFHFIQLLTDLHRSLDRLVEDLAPDQPQLAAALRKEAAWIPRPEEIIAQAPTTGSSACASLGPLLYEALDAGVVDARQFDALMVRRARAAARLRARSS
jgi:hypothetical protein